jgi:predicted AlkP superfamily phosphohydrolase/phosphomutase
MKRLITLILVAVFLANCSSSKPLRKTDFKVVVLGFDGVDPDLVTKWLDHLPNIERLSETGTFTLLGTTNPPETPVAWSSFATGMNPGKHGIFDFLRRDPETYFPDIGLLTVKKGTFLFGILPISRPRITNNRKGTPFWKHLDNSGISTMNLRMPLAFPPEDLDWGTTWSGLGVPDIRGTWGTFFYFASDLTRWDLSDTEFGGRLIKLELRNNIAEAVIDGPMDPRTQDYTRLVIPFEIELNSDSTAATIRLQDQEQTVEEGNWSDWFNFDFSAGPFVSLRGISRFYVLETFPELRVYLMPISLDPTGSPLPISTPGNYSASLGRHFGGFKTLGWNNETWGLNEERIDEGVFLDDLFRNMNYLEKVLLDVLDQDDASLYTAVFLATDHVSHMFYRLIDPQHPRYDKDLSKEYGDAILRVYQKMDLIIGKVLKRLKRNDILIVVSDHGFHSFRKEFNTNTWLVRNGFMSLKKTESTNELKKLSDMFSGGSFFPNVDWGKTKAYALGLGHIYINLKGRESQGIVDPSLGYRKLIKEIREKIIQHKDPDTGDQVLHNTYLRDEIYSGDQVEHAGDIQLTFSSGYRTSWQTSLGGVPEHIVVANLKKWSGDHCASDPADTAGFLLSNRKLLSSDANLIDIAPTLYTLFKVKVPSSIDGKPLKWSAP